MLVCNVEAHLTDLHWISVLMGTELSTASFLAALSAVCRANLRLVKHTKHFIYRSLMVCGATLPPVFLISETWKF